MSSLRSALLCVGLSLFLIPAAAADDPRRFAVELEGGAVWQSRNDVQIPNDATGDRFSLLEVTGRGPWPAARVEFTWALGGRHGLRFVAAPLSINETGVLEQPVRFAGAAFEAGVPTAATYQFNSWRATYRYRVHESDRSLWWIGVTAKVRDAKIRLSQGSTVGQKTDFGFVPLFYLKGDWRFAGPWRLLVDFDGLAGGPGRAIDFSLKVGRDLSDRWSIAAGYRTVEGGADVDAVYNFAWLHYAVVSAAVRF